MKIDMDDPTPFFVSNVMTEAEYAKKNPTPRKRSGPRKLPKPFSPAELEALFKANARHPRERAAMSFLRETGLRSAEALSISAYDAQRWASPRRWRRFPGISVEIMGKGSKARICLLSAEAVKAGKFLAAARTRGPMLPWSDRGLRYALAEAGKRAGVHCHPHRFRHTFAQEIVESGTTIETTADMMGHSNVNTTRIYYTSSVTRRIAANRRRARWRRRQPSLTTRKSSRP